MNSLFNNPLKFLMMLVALTLFFVGSQPCPETSAFRQETDQIQVEQLVACQSKFQTQATVSHAKTIAPIQAVPVMVLSHRISHLVERTPAAEVFLPTLGQKIVSFLIKSHTFHKASEDPHLFS
jgi:hypothetical protein